VRRGESAPDGILRQAVELGDRRHAIEGRGLQAELRCRERGDNVDVGECIEHRFFAIVLHLNPGAARKGDQEEAEESWNGETKPGLDLRKAAIRRVRDRSRNPQNRISARRCARGLRPRHAKPPPESDLSSCFGGRAASLRIVLNRISAR
jgi:hypothetical protein